jgi:hypothetical protein
MNIIIDCRSSVFTVEVVEQFIICIQQSLSALAIQRGKQDISLTCAACQNAKNQLIFHTTNNKAHLSTFRKLIHPCKIQSIFCTKSSNLNNWIVSFQ